MYAIIYWVRPDYVTFIHDIFGDIKTFKTIKEADDYACLIDPKCNKAKVVCLDGVSYDDEDKRGFEG